MAAHTKIDLYQMQSLPLDEKIRMTARRIDAFIDRNDAYISIMITKMSWAFTVAEESYDRETHTRTILKIKKVYDVSAVSIPANNDTEISARAFASRSYERERQELLKRRAAILKIKASL